MIFIKKIAILKRCLSRLYSEQQRIESLSVAYDCKIDRRCLIRVNDVSRIQIGKNSSIGAFTVIDVSDYRDGEPVSRLEIGSNTYIGELNNIRASGGTIKIGDDCLISQNVNIVAANHSYKSGTLINRQPWSTEHSFVEIGNDVWIGAGAIILPGVKIGNGCVIAAGSVVTRSLSDNSIVAGLPARIIRTRK